MCYICNNFLKEDQGQDYINAQQKTFSVEIIKNDKYPELKQKF